MATSSKLTNVTEPEGGDGPRDQWKRFERAVDAAVKSGPKHQKAADQKAAPKGLPNKERPASKAVGNKFKSHPQT
jgi:hypothetical protein